MLTLEKPADLAAHSGALLGRSSWVLIDQPMIDIFAELTGDTQWVHIDTERAARDMPDGRTIAHGLMLLSLIPGLLREVYTITDRGTGLNYGYDRVRFVSPVPAGSRVRLALTLVEAEPHEQGTRIVTEAALELEGSEKPALVARNILLVKDREK